ncbi:MAG: hypothetical protein IJK41_04015 [Muribaculaceae bacterium]|nr:hypothetical protein [Muribaculaceae bacterium]
MMKRLLVTLIVAMSVACSLYAKDDEVIVTRQFTTGQRNMLPEKTITVEMKRLTFAKKADASFIDAITQVMDTIAQEDYLNRTFVLLLEPKGEGEIAIAARNDDIVTRGHQNQTMYYGTFEHKRYNFVLLTSKDNMQVLERTFKRQGKVKFVQEFELVEFRTPLYPTNVIGRWSPDNGLRLLTVSINENYDNDGPNKQ